MTGFLLGFQVKKYRLPPAIRGFKIDQVTDNTLYLVCVVTRGSSWRSNVGSMSSVVMSDMRMRALTEDSEDEDDYDIEALESLGLIRNPRSALNEDIIYDDMDSNDDQEEEETSLLGDFKESLGLEKGQSTLFLFPEWMTGQVAPNYTEDPMLQNFPSSNDTELLILKPMVVNLGNLSLHTRFRHLYSKHHFRLQK